MIEPARYTSGRIALGNLAATIDGLELRRLGQPSFEELAALSKLLFVRGDLLGRIADHDRAERVGNEAVALSPGTAAALHLRAGLAERFHRFEEAAGLVGRAGTAGHPRREVEGREAAILQATGRYNEALVLRQRQAHDDPGIETLGALGSLMAEMGAFEAAEGCYAAALRADDGVSPLPCGQLLFEWGVGAMRNGDVDRAEEIFAELHAIVPAHVPGRGHRAEVALARGELGVAAALVAPLVDASDDPEYRATYAEILAARGQPEAARREAEQAAADYELLLARRPEAYADHAAAFFMGIGDRPALAVELAAMNWQLRDTPRSRRLLARALEARKAA